MRCLHVVHWFKKKKIVQYGLNPLTELVNDFKPVWWADYYPSLNKHFLENTDTDAMQKHSQQTFYDYRLKDSPLVFLK